MCKKKSAGCKEIRAWITFAREFSPSTAFNSAPGIISLQSIRSYNIVGLLPKPEESADVFPVPRTGLGINENLGQVQGTCHFKATEGKFSSFFRGKNGLLQIHCHLCCVFPMTLEWRSWVWVGTPRTSVPQPNADIKVGIPMSPS